MAQGLTNAPAGDVTKKDLAQKAEKTHQHSTTDITSGILPVSRGGTGATTAAGIRNALGLGNTTGALPVANGGTGATTAANARTNLGITPANIGAAASSHSHNYAGSSSAGGSATSAVKLQTARTIKVNLGSTSSANFDGTANITPGVDGTLPIANGGTGAATAASALTNLGLNDVVRTSKLTTELAKKANSTHSHDMGDISGTLSISKGGTGATSASTALSNLGGFPKSGGEIGGKVTITYGGMSIKGNVTIDGTVAEGDETTASGVASHAEGSGTTASGAWSHAEGSGTVAGGYYSHAGGLQTIASGNFQTAIGRLNKESTSSLDVFIIGNGDNSGRSNCLRVGLYAGVYSNSSYSSTGADYAELFQWLDDNVKKEDRVGLFVTLDGEKIKVATPEDDSILGVVSACPSVLGDVYNDDWKDRWEKDIFGRIIFEEVEVPEETIEIPDPENPEQMITKVIQKAHKEMRQKLNPDYDNTQEYIPRSERPEWDAVGMMGKLVVIDDGTCKVNGWCTVGHGGIATSSEKRTKFRVMARLDETHIKIMIL